MVDFDGWEKIEPALGEGGQGIVYKARNPQRAARIRESSGYVTGALRTLQGVGPKPDIVDLMSRIVELGSPDPVESLGALKVLKLPDDTAEKAKARGRLDKEIAALGTANHPAVLKLLHSNLDKGFIVTEYHPCGTLDVHLDEYKGRALEALVAFRPLVQAVALIHKETLLNRHVQGAIHRDIKPENIFVGSDGRLVLGDFGIVLFKDGSGRLTETYERAGSRDWMAPWANTHHRLTLEAVNPTLDIFPLGKVLWCMISGRRSLDYWYFKRPQKGSSPSNNLEELFPDDVGMAVVNEILAACVVENEDDCIQSASKLLGMVDQAIARLRSSGIRPRGSVSWPWRVCGRGFYRKAPIDTSFQIQLSPMNVVNAKALAFVCDNEDCRHIEYFANWQSKF